MNTIGRMGMIAGLLLVSSVAMAEEKKQYQHCEYDSKADEFTCQACVDEKMSNGDTVRVCDPKQEKRTSNRYGKLNKYGPAKVPPGGLF